MKHKRAGDDNKGVKNKGKRGCVTETVAQGKTGGGGRDRKKCVEK